MAEEFITHETASREALKAVFDAAYCDTRYDDDGDLRVQESLSCVVVPNADTKVIELSCSFTFTPDSSHLQRLEAVNAMNTRWLIIRACLVGTDTLRFSYDIPLDGGITPKALVLTVKRFSSIPRVAIRENAADIVL